MSDEFPAVAIILSGPSGVGKSTLCKELFSFSDKFHFSISCTTRTPRVNEQDGIDYHFLTEEDFQCRRLAGEFMEYAQVHRHSYGTLFSEVIPNLQAGFNVILDIDVQGVRQVKNSLIGHPYEKHFISIFVMPPSFEVLKERLLGRKTESAEQQEIRLQHARNEMQCWAEYDYVIVNHNVKESAELLWSVSRAASCRSILKQKEDFEL